LRGVYNRARYSDEMRAALDRWAEHVENDHEVIQLLGPNHIWVTASSQYP
jgi:hypothetical protein